MKKLLTIATLILFLFAAISIAQENETDQQEETGDNETEEETDGTDEENSDENTAEDESDQEEAGDDDAAEEDESEEETGEDESSDDGTGDESDEESESDDENGGSSEETQEPLDEETEEEIELFADSTTGATIRILQLQRAVLKLKISSETTANYLEGKEGFDITGLNALIEELEVLYSEAKALDPASSSRVEDFVYIKNDARDIAGEIREAVRDDLTAADKQALKTQIREAIDASEELAEIKEKIISTTNEHNAERVRNMLGKLGSQDDELLKKVKEGKATRSEVADALKERYQAMTPEEKRTARQEIKTQIQQKTEEIREKASQVRDEYTEKVKERLQERSEQVKEEFRERVTQRLEERIGTMEGRQETMNEKVDARQEKLQERIDERSAEDAQAE